MRLSVRSKILGGSAVLIVLIAGLGLLSISNLSSVNSKAQSAHDNGLAPVEKLSALQTALLDKARAVTYGVVTVGQADAQTTVDTQIAADDVAITAAITDLAAMPLTTDEASTLADLRSKVADYDKLADQMRASSKAGNATAAASQLQAAASVRTVVMSDVTTLMNSAEAGAQTLNDQIGSTYQLGLMATIVLLVLAVLFGIGVSLIVSNPISRGARAVVRQMAVIQDALVAFTHCLEGLSENDLTRIYKSRVAYLEHFGSDEIGATAEGLNSLLGELKKMVGAYEISRNNLTNVIGEVKEAADAVTRTSQELDSASTQTGTATQQIASTITQVATGASDQARAASDTSAGTQELTAMISQVGAGAAETNKRVEQAHRAVVAATAAVSRADRAGEEMQTYAERVHVSLENGIEAVDQTSTGMRRIREAVTATTLATNQVTAKMSHIKYLNWKLTSDITALRSPGVTQRRQDCGPFGICVDLGQAARTAVGKASDFAGGVGNAVSNPLGTWADTGGGIVNTGATWITHHPWEFVGLVTAAVVLTAACIAFCLEAAGAAGAVLAADSLVDAVAACTAACVGAAYNLGIPMIGMGGALYNAANADNPNAEVDMGGLPNSVTDPYASDVDNPSGWSGQLRAGQGRFVEYKTPVWKP